MCNYLSGRPRHVIAMHRKCWQPSRGRPNWTALIRGAYLLIPTVLVTQRDKSEWKASVTAFATIHARHLPRLFELDAELELWNIKCIWRDVDTKILPADAQSTLEEVSPAVFSNIYVLVVLLCIFPVTTCTCERSISTLRRIKTFLRTSTGQDRLSSLCLLSVYRDIPIDLEVIINMFASSNRRRKFLHPELVIESTMF